MNGDTRAATVRRLLVLGTVLGVSGCFSLGRTEPATHHYLLGGSVPPGASTVPAQVEAVTVGIRRLRLAAYLEPPLIAVRRGPAEVGFSEYHRWAEPLGDGINRAVAGHLVARGRFGAVDVAPWTARAAYDYLIQLQVERFEGVAAAGGAGEGEVHMRVNWEILRHEDGVVLARGTTEHRETGWAVNDHSALVRSLDAGVGILADDLSRTLEGFATRTFHLSPP